MSTLSYGASVPLLETTSEVTSVLRFNKVGGLIIAKRSVSLPILWRANFASIKNPTVDYISDFAEVDNLNNNDLFFTTHQATPFQVRQYNHSLSTTSLVIISQVDIPDGQPNNILNMGPYQFIGTIPAYSTPGKMKFYLMGKGAGVSTYFLIEYGSGLNFAHGTNSAVHRDDGPN